MITIEVNHIFVLHIIGSVATITFHWKNGTIKFASTYGDGIRFARPSDVIFTDCIVWEFLLFMKVMDYIDDCINRKIRKYFSKEKRNFMR